MLLDLRDYLVSVFTCSPSRLCVGTALLLVVLAPFAEPDWLGGVCMAGAAVSYGAAGFFTWRRDRGTDTDR